MSNDIIKEHIKIKDSVEVRTADESSPDVVSLAAWLTVTAIVLLGLYVGQGVLVPLAIAFLISFALSPLVTWLVRHRVPRVMSVILVLMSVVTLILGLGLLVGTQVRTLSADLPNYQSTIRAKIEDLGTRMKGPGIFDGVWETVTAVRGDVEQAIGGANTPPATRVEVVSDDNTPVRTALQWLVPALTPIATMGIVLVFVFLALLDRGDLRDRLIRMLGGNLHRVTDALEEAGTRISKYLLMQLIVNVSYGVPMALGLWFIGVPGWILWGTLAALMRFVPYVGPLLSAVFPLTLAFAVDPGWNMVLLTVGLILLLELVSNNIVEPLLYGTSTGLSALSLIAAATFWTALWGPVGLILSTPLTVCLLVIGRNLPQLHFLDTLLGSTAVLDVSTRIYQRLIANDPEEAIEIASEVIDKTSVAEFYDEHGIAILRQASEDFLTQARAEHRLRVVNGMDVMFDDLRELYPGLVDAAAASRVACIGGKWEVDTVACEMLVHALSFHGIAAAQRPGGVLTGRYVDKLGLKETEIVCLSYFSQEPELSARSFCRRLRRRWPNVRIVLALWNVPALYDPQETQMGADAVVFSLNEATRQIEQMLSPEIVRQRQIAEPPADDAKRVAALEATAVLDGHAREALDALAVRAAEVFDVEFAVISAIGDKTEFIVGQSVDLPGELSRDGTQTIILPRHDAICDHVVSGDRLLVINDTQRDPRFVDHPALNMWDTRFYAGAPLRTSDGMVLGALCLMDRQPRELSKEEQKLLTGLAEDIALVITGESASRRLKEPDISENSTTTSQIVPQ